VEQFGCRILAQYAVLGAFDFVSIVEAPDTGAITHLSAHLGAQGTVISPRFRRSQLPAIWPAWANLPPPRCSSLYRRPAADPSFRLNPFPQDARDRFWRRISFAFRW
jgi:hypothetical protein